MIRRLLSKTSPVSLCRTEFWCAGCDGQVVISRKPETGAFYNMFGRVWEKPTRDQEPRDRQIGKSVQILVAFCPECIEKLGLES